MIAILSNFNTLRCSAHICGRSLFLPVPRTSGKETARYVAHKINLTFHIIVSSFNPNVLHETLADHLDVGTVMFEGSLDMLFSVTNFRSISYFLLNIDTV